MTDASWSHVLTDSSKEETRTVAVCRAIYPQVNIFFIYISYKIFHGSHEQPVQKIHDEYIKCMR